MERAKRSADLAGHSGGRGWVRVSAQMNGSGYLCLPQLSVGEVGDQGELLCWAGKSPGFKPTV